MLVHLEWCLRKLGNEKPTKICFYGKILFLLVWMANRDRGSESIFPLIKKHLPIVATTPTRRFGSERPLKCKGWIASNLQKNVI